MKIPAFPSDRILELAATKIKTTLKNEELRKDV